MNPAADPNGIDALVKFYLQSRGYQKALDALKEETEQITLATQPSSSSLLTIDSNTAMVVDDNTQPPDHTNPSVNDQRGNSGSGSEKNIEKLLLNAAESLCFLGIKQGDILSYNKEYDVIYSWMNQSLDTIRPYLQAINFALFVYW